MGSAPPVSGANDFAAALRAFGLVGLAAVLVILTALFFVGPLAAALLVIGWAWWSQTPWQAIGYARPASWLRGLAVGILLGIALKLLLKAMVMPLLGAPAGNPVYHYLAGNPAAALQFAVFNILIGAAWAEETVYRGWMFERLGRAPGPTHAATVAIVVFTAAVFAFSHYLEQGPPGVEQAIFTGLAFGTMYALTGSIWMPLCAHAAYDLTAVALIYFGLEAQVARLFFQ